jgi:hypothetical protein
VMKALPRMLLLSISLAVTSCAPDPFGVDCRTSPSCQRREEKKHRAAMAEHEKSCKAAGQAWIENASATPALQCEPAKHACTSQHGCPHGTRCSSQDGEGSYCISDENSWAGHCVACADRAAMEAGKAKDAKEKAEEDARLARKAQASAEAMAVAEDEQKRGACSERGRTVAEKALADMEREWPVRDATPEKRGTAVAGSDVRVELDATPGARYTLRVAAVPPISVSSPNRESTHSSTYGTHFVVSESAVAAGARVGWTVTATGCIAWTVVRESKVANSP